MAVVQSTYGENIRAAVAGLVANMETANSISRIVEDAAGIGFGVAVFQGTADNGVTATPADDTFVGITIRDVTREPTDSDTYPETATAGVLTMGVVWVEAGATVAAGEAVYVTPAGAVTNTDNTGANPALTGAKFDSSGDSGDLVKVRLA